MSANDELQAHTCEKMLQEYGNVANNVAQGNSQHLTEQWKNGELERGWYYIKKLLKDRVVMDFYYGNDVDRWMDNYDEEIKEVLAQVPSYKEWKQLHKFLEEFNALDVAKENQQLKELLYSLKCCLTSENIEPQIRVEKSLAKIDEVLK